MADPVSIGTLLAALAAGGSAGVAALRKPEAALPQAPLEQIALVNDTVLHFKSIFQSLTNEEVAATVKAVERIAEIVNREDPDNPGQKLVWKSTSMQKILRQMAENDEQQTRILKSLADSVSAINERLQYLEIFVKMQQGK